MTRSVRRRAAFATALACVSGCSFLVDTANLEGEREAGPELDASGTDGPAGGGDSATDGAMDSPPILPNSITDGDARTASGGTPGLIAEWHFDEKGGSTAYDTSGFGHYGRVVGGARLGDPGKVGGALTVSGGLDAVIVDDLGGSAFPRTGTLAMWINSSLTDADTETCGVFDQWDNSREHVFVRRPPASASFQVSFQRAEAGVPYAYSTTFAAPAGTWKHVVVTWDEAKGAGAVFIDGVQLSGYAYGGGSFAPTGQVMRFGSNFKGLIDEARLYDRVLSSTEIAALP